ncbi:MAG: hypothetical protein C5B55_09840 [Blastocatellia bacterium]|nr:MAG: hypothetical protein C5B55_09840 [Blastocatellia bacterium]
MLNDKLLEFLTNRSTRIPMTKRPIYVTLIGLFFIVLGTLALGGGLMDLFNSMRGHPVRNSIGELLIMCLTRLIGLIAGVFLLKRKNWARWLCIAWMAFHVILTLLPPPKVPQLVIHIVFLSLLLFFLFRPRANEYFAR